MSNVLFSKSGETNVVAKWEPEIGPEISKFLDECVNEESRKSIEQSSVDILSKGVSPNNNLCISETGLVVGYVQSGKTMSFEAVTALARDNKFQIIIVIAGISNPLLQQSTNRLKNDLKLSDSKLSRRWIQLVNPDSSDDNLQVIRSTLDPWRDSSTPAIYRQTLIITVLKNHLRIKNLAELMEKIDLTNFTSLVIDDEADQVSLNSKIADDDESTTYNRLMKLRHALKKHTYLQYTATPQAPLLINIIENLSPNFVQVLEPGDQYVGGKDFFSIHNKLIGIIPEDEIGTKQDPLTEPPATLLEALRIFMIGVTAGLITSANKGNRSMLVHPSHLKTHHRDYYGWVRAIFDHWKSCLDCPDDDQDKKELIEEFRLSYLELKKTANDKIPPFQELISSFKYAFTTTQVMQVNSNGGKTPQIDWQHKYGWILVGGMALDRGFTVEGLTVTYMPRGIGTGNADTIQQRARFFGYKRSYLGFCRIYLGQESFNAFQNYVKHEDNIRSQLKAIQRNDLSLKGWKRAFILDNKLKPCRDSILDLDYIRTKNKEDWYSPQLVFTESEIVSENRNTIDSFKSTLSFVHDSGHSGRTEYQKHLICNGISLSKVLEELLIPFKVLGSKDSQKNIALLLQLSMALEKNSDEKCTVYIMSPNMQRKRTINANGEILNLFQGEFPVELENRGKIYPGDRNINDKECITVQIHNIDLFESDEELVEKNVPILAVWIPKRISNMVLVQRES